MELVDGLLYEMDPQSPRHAMSVSLTLYELLPLFSVDFYIRVRMPLALGPDSEPEPDIAVVSGTPEDYGSSHPASAMLIVEASESSLLHDRKRKASLYARMGIPDYWLMNLVDWQLEVYRDPQDGEYRSRTILRFGESVTPLVRPDLRIAVADLLPENGRPGLPSQD